jgi:hypothetical protein
VLSLAAAALVGAALPAPLAAQETIVACVRLGGRLRVVAPTQACELGEQRLTWSTQAPPPGPKGPCDDKIGQVAFTGLPGQGLDAPSDLGFLELNVTRGDPAGAPHPVPATLYKKVDHNSPRLIMAAALLAPLTTVRVDIPSPNPTTTSLTVVLEDPVLVTGYRFATPNSEVICEEIDLDFCQIEVTSVSTQGASTTVRFNRCGP